MGHVRRHGAGWVYVIDRLPVIVDGKVRRRPQWVSGFATKTAAKRALRQAESEQDAGGFVEPTELTVGEYLQEVWLPAASHTTMKPSTLSLYQQIIRVHVVPGIGPIRLQALSPTDLRAFYRRLASKGSKGGAGPLGPRAVRNVHAVIRRALRDAASLDEGLVPSHLLRNVAAVDGLLPNQSAGGSAGGEMLTWTPDELAVFLSAVDCLARDHKVTCKRKAREACRVAEYDYTRTVVADPMAPALWYVAALTGMRRGEVCGLRWRQVDLEAGTASVVRSVAMVDGRRRHEDESLATVCRSRPARGGASTDLAEGAGCPAASFGDTMAGQR